MPLPPAPSGGAPPGGRGWRATLAEALDLPRELVLDLPRVILLGALQVAVENHRGLLEFASGRVAIATRAGRLVIEGAELSVSAVHAGQIVVAGRVAGVRFEPGTPDGAG